MFIRLSTCVCLALVAVAPSSAQLPNPRLDRLFPPGGQVGQTVVVGVAGRDLDDASRLIFSHPGLVGSVHPASAGESSEPQAVADRFEVQIPSNIAPGLYDVRVVGRFGASTPRVFEVSDVAEMTASTPHQASAQALPLPIDTVVNSRVEPGSIDYYRFSAQRTVLPGRVPGSAD